MSPTRIGAGDPAGRESGKPKARAFHHEMKMLSLVDRESSQVRSVIVDDPKPNTIRPILVEKIIEVASLHTEESTIYMRNGGHRSDHQTVIHKADECVRGAVHTNASRAGYFSVFKRGMKDVYQHRGEQHLHRYLAKFTFRYNNRVKLGVEDVVRIKRASKGISGKTADVSTVSPSAVNRGCRAWLDTHR